MEFKVLCMCIMYYFLLICLYFYRKKICSNVKIEIKYFECGFVFIFFLCIRYGVFGL